MAVAYSIDDVKKLFGYRAGTRGISSNVTADKFNSFWNSAEMKFFNQLHAEYAKTQTISDSISKWMTDPMFIPVNANGIFQFFTNMNLLHVDSMSNYVPATGSNIATLGTLTPGSGYTDGSYPQTPLTGGTGSGATAYIVVLNGAIVACLPQLQGSGYAVNDTLSASLSGGTGFSIKVTSITGATQDNPVTRVEKFLWSANTSSSYEYPTQQYPIYTQFSNHFEFAPKNIGFAKIVYLQQPIWSYWGYNLQGYIATLTGLVGGTGYTNGTYTNVPLTGGLGNGALATIVVSGGVVINPVQITIPGKMYLTGDVLSAAAANIGGTGTGFSITVSSLVPGSIRAFYNPAISVQPLWNSDDISTIVDLALADAAIAARDRELTNFAENTSNKIQ